MVLIRDPVRLRLVHRLRYDMHPSFLQAPFSLPSLQLLPFSINNYTSSHPRSHMVITRADWKEALRVSCTRILLTNNLVILGMFLQYPL